MLDTRTPQRMIQFSAPAPAATPASPSTVAPGAAGALAKAPENRQFSEVLGATEDAAAPAGADVPDLALAAAADGKIGKRPGKILPEAMEPASALPDPAEAPASDMPEPLAAPLPDTGGAAAAMLPVILPIAAFTAARSPRSPSRRAGRPRTVPRRWRRSIPRHRPWFRQRHSPHLLPRRDWPPPYPRQPPTPRSSG